MSEIAEELSRRASPHHARERVKEMAVEKGQEIRERVVESPLTYRIGGGILGALIAGAIGRRFVSRRREGEVEWEWEGQPPRRGSGPSGIGAHAEGLGEQVSGKADALKERASELGQQGSERVEHVRERASSAVHRARDYAVEARGRAAGWSARSFREQPLTFALGALALGAALGAVLPVSRRERRAFTPARERAGEKLGHVVDRVEEKIRGPGEREAGAAGAERPSVTGQRPESPGAGQAGLPLTPAEPGPSVH